MLHRLIHPLLCSALLSCAVAEPLYQAPPESSPARPEAAGKGFVTPSAHASASPMSLTASDGSGLELTELRALAEIDDPIARTQLQLRFDNPRPEIVEGKLQVSLPPGASITGFAMKVEGQWREAAVVERQRGRVAYEESLHAGVDPALLERSAGNVFGVRVFPIPASSHVDLRLEYTETLRDPSAPYRLALRGLPRVGTLQAEAGVATRDGTRTWTEYALEAARPDEDFVVQRHAEPERAWRHGPNVLARVVVPDVHDEPPPTGGFTVLFDTSASAARGYEDSIDRLSSMLAALASELDPSTPLTVIPFDQEVGAPVYRGPLRGYGLAGADARLRQRGALGASNLRRALKGAEKTGHERLVVFTDGVVTIGDRAAESVTGALEQLATAGVQRIDVIAGANLRDEETLHTLTARAGTKLPGIVLDAELDGAQLAKKLLQPMAPAMEVHVEGATRIFPATLAGLQAMDAALVYASFEGAPPPDEVSVSLRPSTGATQTLRLSTAEREDEAFERAWHIADIEERIAALGGSNAPAVRRELIDLSVKHRIINDLTALIVMETDADYARSGFTPPSGSPANEDAESSSLVPTVGAAESSTYMSMEDFRNIPVGQSQGRDFTQVVEASATVPRDSAGISLSGASAGRGRARRRRARPRAVRKAGVDVRVSRVRGDLTRRWAEETAAGAARAIEPCWFDALADDWRSGTAKLRLVFVRGAVESVELLQQDLRLDTQTRRCMDEALRGLPGRGSGRMRLTFDFRAGTLPPRSTEFVSGLPEEVGDVHEGNFAAIADLLRDGAYEDADALARRWHASAPEDVMALTALGRVAEARGDTELAVRAYGSLAELHPSDAPSLRFAAGRLQVLGPHGLSLALDLLAEAQRQRPDHPSSHRALAWAHAQRGAFEQAFEALARGYDRTYPAGRFASARVELGEELGIVGAVWAHHAPQARKRVEQRLADLGLTLAQDPSLRFVLTWETDANDVDLHIRDGGGEVASYATPKLQSGGELLADVTTGFGPETFVIRDRARAYPYDVFVHYYARGPMGYGMGQVQIVRHDGGGGLEVDNLPFVVMKDHAKLGVGSIERRRAPLGR